MNPFKRSEQNTEHDAHQWVTVSETFGTANTKMIVEYLRENGIVAIVSGSTSLGLLTGANSPARVMVTEEDVEKAMYLLEPEGTIEGDENNASENDDPASVSDVHKAVLGATAIAFNPLGAGIAYVVSKTVSLKDKSTDDLIDCPGCGNRLDLSQAELEKRQLTCPECAAVISLEGFVVCPTCQSELELDAEEQSHGWYVCPECRWAHRIMSM
jgi:uncharacterized protein YbaR (Trm112 family)